MGDPRRDDLEPSSTLLHCFLAEGAGGGVGLLDQLNALDPLADPPVPSSGGVTGQQSPTSPLTASS